ncbi:hypothetical protein GQ457_09G025750 [Hibiscus cannabinus]
MLVLLCLIDKRVSFLLYNSYFQFVSIAFVFDICIKILSRLNYVGEFNYWMDKIEKACDIAYKWLKEKPAEEWSRSHFRTFF